MTSRLYVSVPLISLACLISQQDSCPRVNSLVRAGVGERSGKRGVCVGVIGQFSTAFLLRFGLVVVNCDNKLIFFLSEIRIRVTNGVWLRSAFQLRLRLRVANVKVKIGISTVTEHYHPID